MALYKLARYEFDGVLDGIVYGSLIGFGFAMVENIFYFLGSQDDLNSWGGVVVARTLAFGLNHAMYTSFTGIGFGLARYRRTAASRRALIVAGLLAAITAHFLHNFFLSVGELCLISFALDWLGVIVVLAVILLAWRREREWIATELQEEVASGVLSAEQFESVKSRRRQAQVAWRDLGASGLQRAKLGRRLLVAATELAFKKHQRRAMGEESDNGAGIAALRVELLRLRHDLGDPGVEGALACSHCGRPSYTDASVCALCSADDPSSSVSLPESRA